MCIARFFGFLSPSFGVALATGCCFFWMIFKCDVKLCINFIACGSVPPDVRRILLGNECMLFLSPYSDTGVSGAVELCMHFSISSGVMHSEGFVCVLGTEAAALRMARLWNILSGNNSSMISRSSGIRWDLNSEHRLPPTLLAFLHKHRSSIPL